MALDEIRALLRFKEAPSENCGDVNALLDAHIGHVADRIGELKRLEQQLRLQRDQCRDVQSAQEYGILKELSGSVKLATARAGKRHVHGSHS